MPAIADIGTLKPTDLPAPPQHAVRILKACADSAVTSQQLADIVTADPQLTAELLRLVNSPFFGVSRKISSAAHAVTYLGQRALRNLVLCLAMRDALRPQAIPGFDAQAYWEDALRRAAAARRLGELARIDADECFTAGLLQNFGLLALLYVMPEHVGQWPTLQGADPEARQLLERRLFGVTHDRIAAQLAAAWALPEDLSFAMAQHHHPDAEGSEMQRGLAQVCRVADWVAAAFVATDVRAVIGACRELLHNQYGLDEAASDALLMALGADVEASAQALGFKVNEPIDFQQVLQAANAQLIEANLSYQELTWHLEKALAERDAYAETVQQDLELAREIQQGLLPKHGSAAKGVTAINLPAREVSGDFYDYFTLADGRVYFCVADVSGKGMNAALLMAKTSSLFHCLGKALHHPGKLLTMINAELCETALRGLFVSMVAGLFEPLTGRVRLVNAGHPPPLLKARTGKLSELPAQSPPLGILPELRLPEHEFLLAGGSLYIYTDGLTEARDAKDAELGMGGLARLITTHERLAPAERIKAMLAELLVPDKPLHDDLTLLVLET